MHMYRSFIVPIKPPTVASLATAQGEPTSDSDTTAASHLLARHLALLLDVVRSRRWSAFEAIALSHADVFRSINDAFPKYANGTATLLHAVLSHDPPARVVAKMVAALPTDPAERDDALLHARDSSGRTPLHVACASGGGGGDDCDPLAIKVLASACPSANEALDDDGRAPLHLLACEGSDRDAADDDNEAGPCSINGRDDDEESQRTGRRRHREQRSLLKVCALLSESIGATLLEDDHGMTPLELAIVSDAPMGVVELLQKATQKATMMMESSPKTKRETIGRSNKKPTLLDGEAAKIRQSGEKRQLLGCTSARVRKGVVF